MRARVLLGALVVGYVLCVATEVRAQDLAPVPPPPPQQQQQQPYPPPPPQPPQQQYPPPPQQQPYPPPPQQQPYTPPPPTGAPGPGGYYVANQPGAAPGTPRRPADPGRRSGEEILELYLTMSGIGTLGGFAIAASLDSDDTYPWLVFPALGGLAAVGNVALLDMDRGMREGIPTSITTGGWWGLANGLFLWGAHDERPSAAGVLTLLALGSVVGSAVGGLAGWASRPTIGDNRLVLSAGVWAGLTAWTSALAFDAHGNRFAYKLGLVGLNVGALGAFIVAATTDVSLETAALFNGGAFMGALVGLGIAGLVHEVRERDGLPHGAEITAAGVAIGSGSGILIGILVAGIDSAERSERAAATSFPDLAVAATPVEGGLVVTAGAPL